MRHLLALVISVLALSLPTGGQVPLAQGKPWVVPRTPDGKPDLQGNWTNETQTPLERTGTTSATLTEKEAAAIEERARVVAEFRDQASDPSRPAPPKGGDNQKQPQ